MNDIIARAAQCGWKATLLAERKNLPAALIDRYSCIPQEYIDFICSVEEFISADETSWLITCDGFAEENPEKWRYNEFELMSLDAAADDEEWRADIIAFWDVHLPVMLCVGGGYSYYAISLDDGCIVHGYEPEFEEIEIVADSFAEFMEKLLEGELL